MGLLDGTLQQKILRLEKLTDPKQYGAGSKANQRAIDKLRNHINRIQAKKKKKLKIRNT